MDYSCNVKYGAFFTIARPFLDRRNFYHEFFFGTNVFLNEGKQLCSWKFFKLNRFGNRISRITSNVHSLKF